MDSRTDALSSSPPRALWQQSATELAALVRSGEVSALEVVNAHLARIDERNALVNAVVVRCDAEARQAAEQIDAQRQRGEPLGPLAGVPITIKECFDIAGLPTTIGLPARRAHRAAADSPLVARLRAAGAIVLGKTNVPQLMLMHETFNPLYGRTVHPLRTDRSPGGSSGGEAAAVASGFSALGLGSDLGGSIRQPAHTCGICGLKPTPGRLTNIGSLSAVEGMEAMTICPGPLARSVDDLALAFDALRPKSLREAALDEVVVPLGDARTVEVSQLRVGLWTDDGYFTPAPATVRAAREAAERLRAAGVTVEEFTPPDVRQGLGLFVKLLGADGGANLRRLTAGEVVEPDVRLLMRLAGLPRWLRQSLAASLRLVGQRRSAQLLGAIGPLSASEYWQLLATRSAYVENFFTAFDARRFDAILCPPHALPALTHGSFQYLAAAGSYGYLMNLLGLPAGVVPWTTVRAGEETGRAASNDHVERAALAVEAASAGLPIGVQIAAPPWREDVVLALLRVLTTAAD